MFKVSVTVLFSGENLRVNRLFFIDTTVVSNMIESDSDSSGKTLVYYMRDIANSSLSSLSSSSSSADDESSETSSDSSSDVATHDDQSDTVSVGLSLAEDLEHDEGLLEDFIERWELANDSCGTRITLIKQFLHAYKDMHKDHE